MPRDIVPPMVDVIVSVLGTAGWLAGLLLLLVMAALPFAEHVGGGGR